MLIPLLYLVLDIAVIGFIVWLITTYIPMPEIFKTVLMVLVAIVVIVWILGMLQGGGIASCANLLCSR